MLPLASSVQPRSRISPTARWIVCVKSAVLVEGDLRRRSHDEHQASDGPWLLSWPAPPQGLPVRGQRTRTNARTRKGRAKAIAGKVIGTGHGKQDCYQSSQEGQKNVAEGIAHIHVLSTTRSSPSPTVRKCPVVGDFWWRWLQRLAQVHAVCARLPLKRQAKTARNAV